jgi:hypothetical protein
MNENMSSDLWWLLSLSVRLQIPEEIDNVSIPPLRMGNSKIMDASLYELKYCFLSLHDFPLLFIPQIYQTPWACPSPLPPLPKSNIKTRSIWWEKPKYIASTRHGFSSSPCSSILYKPPTKKRNMYPFLSSSSTTPKSHLKKKPAKRAYKPKYQTPFMHDFSPPPFL